MLFINFKTTLEGSTTKERELSFPVSRIKYIDHEHHQIHFENFSNSKGADCIQITKESFGEVINALSGIEEHGFLLVTLK
jgi:hypothetical protein